VNATIVRRILAFCGALGAGTFPVYAFAAQGDPVSPQLAPYVSVNAKSVAIEHVRVIDGTGRPAQADRTVLFTNGLIAAVGPAAKTNVPAGTTVIDGTGKTLLPGYVGLHNHLFTGAGPRHHPVWRSMPFSFPRLYLAAGTTTIRTTGSMDIYADLHAKHSVDAGLSPGPDMDVTSPYLTGPGNPEPQMDELKGAADARATVAFWADRGVTSFKVYTNITREALGAVIDEAHRRGLKVMGHLCSVGYHEAAALGIDELEHGPYFTDTEFVDSKTPDACPTEDEQDATNAHIAPTDPRITALIADLVHRHVPVSSTLPVFEAGYRVPPDAIEQPTLDLMAPDQKATVEAIRTLLQDPKTFAGILKTHPNYLSDGLAVFKNEMAFELRFARAGGILTCGPDPSGYGSVIAGLGDWRELELLVEAGFTPVEAIHVATQNGAIALGRADSIGTIAVGKRADAILIDGDPSSDITAIEHVETVFKGGQGYDSKKLFASVKGLVGAI
jgi:imidazolonepropionase-like amidohydrolase